MVIKKNRINNLKVFKSCREGVIYRLDSDTLYKRLLYPTVDNFNTITNLIKIPKKHDSLPINKPIDVVYEDGKFKGYTFKDTFAIDLKEYFSKEVEIEKKINILRQIGDIIKYMNNDPDFASIFIGDLREENIMVKDDKPIIIDATGFKTEPLYKPAVFYVNCNHNLNTINKYHYGDGTIDRNTDIYCLNCIVFNFIAGSNIIDFSKKSLKSYSNFLKRKGASLQLIESLKSIYLKDNILYTTDYLDGLPKNLKKVSASSFYNSFPKRLFF